MSRAEKSPCWQTGTPGPNVVIRKTHQLNQISAANSNEEIFEEFNGKQRSSAVFDLFLLTDGSSSLVFLLNVKALAAVSLVVIAVIRQLQFESCSSQILSLQSAFS